MIKVKNRIGLLTQVVRQHSRPLPPVASLEEFSRLGAGKELTPLEKAMLPAGTDDAQSMLKVLKHAPKARRINPVFLHQTVVDKGVRRPAFATFRVFGDNPFFKLFKSEPSRFQLSFSVDGSSGAITSMYEGMNQASLGPTRSVLRIASVISVALTLLALFYVFAFAVDPNSNASQSEKNRFLVSLLVMIAGVVASAKMLLELNEAPSGEHTFVAKLPEGFVFPASARELCHSLVKASVFHASDIFLVTDSCTWEYKHKVTLPVDRDPLLIGRVDNMYFLLDQFDLTPLEAEAIKSA